MKLSIRILLGAVFEAKKTGKGRSGKGKIYTQLMGIISDSSKTDISMFFSGNTDRFILRMMRGQTDYPYSLFRFENFEKNIGNRQRYQSYIISMKSVCSDVLDENKIEQLVYTLLEAVRQDSSISEVLYNSDYVPKEKLFGSCSHPRRICPEALLLGLLYYVHKNPAESENVKLLEVPEKLTFCTVRYSGEDSLDLEIPIDFIENIHQNSKRQKTIEIKYQPEFKYNDEVIDKLPEDKDIKNIFLYGTGGAGKTSFLLNRLRNRDTVNFYLPLYQYKCEVHENFQNSSCWILVQILLKYRYSYDYHTYGTLIAAESEKVVLQQLSELERELKLNPFDRQNYTLFLDGFNEMTSDTQREFIKELELICREWKNIRIIITGRTVPDCDLFKNFYCTEICGISECELNSALSVLPNCSEILLNKKLTEILKNPLFLNIYTDNRENSVKINTRGEILDSYVMNWKVKSYGTDSSVIRFIIQYILPFAAKTMVDNYNFFAFTDSKGVCFEIDRRDLYLAINKAYETYLLNELVYQSCIAPKGFRKKVLLESRTENDFIEIILENIGLMKISENNPQKLCFTHQYFRDYFSAKQILNLLNIIETAYKNSCIDEKKEVLKQLNLDRMWFFSDYEYEIYKLIGEICGDYKNIPDENDSFFLYNRTVLDRILDMYREFDSETDDFYITHNIMTTMRIVRSGMICGVNFDKIPLPFNIPCSIKFSMYGEYPCTFRYCKIHRIGIFSAGNDDVWAEYAVCSPDKKFILIIIDNNYVILWSIYQEKIVREYDLSEYAENNIVFNYAEFSPEGQYIMLRAYDGYNMKTYEMKFETFTGKVVSCNSGNIQIYDTERYFIDENLKCRIFSQLTHFKNCNFTGTKFVYEDYRNYLRITGTILK